MIRESIRSISVSMAGRAPSTFNREDRSVGVIAATEDPVMVWDYGTGGQIGEVLLMSGVKLPKNHQIPLTDTHNISSLRGMIGSAREFSVNGDKLSAQVIFSSSQAGEEAMTLLEEGHLTDFSIRYNILKEVRLKPGENRTLGGRQFSGPLLVVTSWSARELAACPIGADPRSKARSDVHGASNSAGSTAKAIDPPRSLDQRARNAWDADSKLRDEFRGDFTIYLAYVKATAAGRVHICHGDHRKDAGKANNTAQSPNPGALDQGARSAWTGNAALRAEFLESFDRYLAYLRAIDAGLVRMRQA